MVSQCIRYDARLCIGTQSMQPHKYDAMMDEAKTINEFAEILVFGHED